MSINSIDNLISDKYKIQYNENHVYMVEETDSNCRIKNPKKARTTIKSQGINLLYKFDDDKNLLPFFKDVEGAKCMVDYIYFMEHNNSIFIFLIELSKSKTKYYQKEASELFIQYVIQTSQRIYPQRIQDIYFKYILLKSSSVKLTTKIKPKKNYVLPLGRLLELKKYCLIC
ncbi:MAG: hypothetical protein ACM3U1_04295 [Chloroflexota bacterium]